MKLTGTLLLALAIFAGGSRATAQQKQEHVQQESIFQRNFRRLHQEPPPPQSQSRKSATTLWITQKLDNFNEQDDRTWKMRYMANDEFYQDGGPLFIFVGGEWPITPGYVTGGHWYDMAKEHNGYLFYTEHRYYGQSRPTSDITFANLKYLDVQQALADLAHFIRTMKSTIPGMANSKVILAGGSYSATMVTWFKKLYPDLANGCWASSGPLLAKLDIAEFLEVTGQSIRLISGDPCYQRIQNGIAELEFMLANKRGAEVKAILKLCNNFDESNDLDVWTLFNQISEIFVNLVQTHTQGKIEGACNRILMGDNDLAGLANYLLSAFDSDSCSDISYRAQLDILLDSTYSDIAEMRQWTYQTCNEYGWYQTTNSRNQPFGTKLPATLYTTLCADGYGKQFSNEFINQQLAKTNNLFGGLSPNVENVYQTHGQLDPWRSVGIQDPKEATIITGYAHCKDFGSITSSDSPALRASKEKIAALIREWIATTAKA